MLSTVWLVVSCCVFVLFLPVSASNSASNSTDHGPIAEGGFTELVLTRLDHLQLKLQEVDLALKERDEENVEAKVQLENVLGSLQVALGRLRQEIGYNLTTLQRESWKIRAQQTACANHEQMRKDISQLSANSGLPRNAWRLNESPDHRRKALFESCKDLVPRKTESGVVWMRVSGVDGPFEAFCEQDKFKGGWLVVLRRFNGSLDFARNWTEYRDGFGNVQKEFWIGLERLHQLTSRRAHELMLELRDADGRHRYAHYNEFEVGSEAEQYLLKKLGPYSGMAGDAMGYHKGMKFTTLDRDNDFSDANCAIKYGEGWWHRLCPRGNSNENHVDTDNSTRPAFWQPLIDGYVGKSYSMMMIREI